jgi:nucleoside 2-deoxyribosyltransferase
MDTTGTKATITKVYLGGGFRSGWQSKARAAAPRLKFLDPSSHNLTDPIDFTKWDLNAVRCSDIVFAYLEEHNPGGYSLALEIGYAKALHKVIVLVDEMSRDVNKARHLLMVRQSATVVFETLSEGLVYLSSLQSSSTFAQSQRR